jgi:hypothetical protein
MNHVDFDAISKNFEYFWNNEYFGRCAVWITAPRSRNVEFPRPETPEDLIREWTDGELILKKNRLWAENTCYRGEAYPQIILNLGAAGHAGFFNKSRFQFTENTVWFFPLDKGEKLVFSKDTFLYRATVDLARYLADNSNDEFIISMSDCCGNADALAHLRGSEQLLFNMLDDPDTVKKELAVMQMAWEEITRDVYCAVKENNRGGSSIGWMGTYARGLHAQMQSDMSVMISPDQFREFILDELIRQSDVLEYPCYHLDGREQMRHIEMLLSIKKLRMIQYTFVAGQPSPLEQLEALKKIQQGGKLLLLFLDPKDIKPVLENLSARGLFIHTWCDDPEDADRVFKIVREYSRA